MAGEIYFIDKYINLKYNSLKTKIMAREFAKKFYSSGAWTNCSKGYKAYRRYLCENCLAKGIYRQGEIVHHKIELSPVNIDNPEITLNWDNLRLLCRDCHAKEHNENTKNRRYVIGDNGEVKTI